MEKSFFDRLSTTCMMKDSLLCVGLDPRLPEGFDASGITSAIVSENRRIIELTAPWTACYKPNIAFYEAAGVPGLYALEQTLALIPDDIPVILDTKRCDIGATAEAYAQAIFGRFGADATTLAPYMGFDAVKPFLAFPGKGVFMLCRTSNPSAARIQELDVGGRLLYLAVAEECLSWGGAVGLVVAGNEPIVLRAIRERFPSAWFLAPGIGAQGGDAGEAVAAGADSDGLGILPVVARGIASSDDPAGAARAFRDDVNRARDGRARGKRSSRGTTAGAPGGASAGGAPSRPHQAAADAPVPPADAGKQALLSGLIETGCFRIGEFVLKSGKTSPFYIDLRRIISSPALLRLTGRAYASLIASLTADRIAAIPVAALPLGAAASIETGIPLVFPRLTVKDHGTGNLIEGDYRAGDRVILLDDLITTGKSKLEAVEILRSEGLIVEDLVVLLERGVQGRKDMERAGIALHSFAGVEELLEVCESTGLIDRKTRERLAEYSREG